MKQGNKNRIKKDPPMRPNRPEIRQTKLAGGDFVDKLCAYRDHNAQVLFASLGRLVGSPFTSMMTIAVLAIAITLASGFYIFVKNVQQLAGNLETSNQISLFLKDEMTEAQAHKLAESIRQNSSIQSVTVISKEQALEEFKTYSGFGSAINALKKNPLPIVLLVLPKHMLDDKQALTKLEQGFQQTQGVDFVQMDLQWVERLQAIIALAKLFAALLNTLLGAAVLFIIGNTIRLELHNRHDEVVIAKLVGATHAFIRRPFLYTGFWIGFISGVLAWFIVAILMLVLRAPVEKLSGLYDEGFHLLFLNVTETLVMILLASGLGVLGAWGVVAGQLQSTKLE